MNSAVQFVNKGQILRNSNYLIITEQRVLYVRHVSAGRRKLILNTATTKLKSTMAARSKAWVYGRSLAGIPGSNPAGGMDVCLL